MHPRQHSAIMVPCQTTKCCRASHSAIRVLVETRNGLIKLMSWGLAKDNISIATMHDLRALAFGTNVAQFVQTSEQPHWEQSRLQRSTFRPRPILIAWKQFCDQICYCCCDWESAGDVCHLTPSMCGVIPFQTACRFWKTKIPDIPRSPSPSGPWPK